MTQGTNILLEQAHFFLAIGLIAPWGRIFNRAIYVNLCSAFTYFLVYIHSKRFDDYSRKRYSIRLYFDRLQYKKSFLIRKI